MRKQGSPRRDGTGPGPALKIEKISRLIIGINVEAGDIYQTTKL